MTGDTYRSLGASAELDDHPVVPYYVPELQKRISVTALDGTLYAFDDLCPEHHCALSAGLLKGPAIMCQCGGCEFDIASGKVLKGPATQDLGTYPVRKRDGNVEAVL